MQSTVVDYIIERFGLTGYQVGNAQISTKHSNYIVNLGNAKATDVIAIIDKVKETFFDTFGFYPEAEVEIVGV